MNEWNGFKGDKWKKSLDVEDFIINNYKEYVEEPNFLVDSSKKTEKVWSRCQKILAKEVITGVLDVDTTTIAGIDNYEAGYIDKKNEVILGLQTDEPLKRIIHPLGGMEVAHKAASSYGYQLDMDMRERFNVYHKSCNEGIADAYTKEINQLKENGVLHGLPEEYGRGMIIGDYRRLALYGADHLIARKERDLEKLVGNINFAMIRMREEVREQIQALRELKKMANRYDIDISRPANNATQAIQWLYFAYLATIKQSNGMINSFGRNTAFIDVYIERDMEAGLLNEVQAQELIDQLIIKLRLVRHLRKAECKEYLTGDSTWVTESIGGMLNNEVSFVTKTSYRFLHVLNNLGVSPEPNYTILWSGGLPDHFKKYVHILALKTHAIQYVNDDRVRTIYGTDYAIVGSASAVKLGKQMIYSGASCNLVKAVLYAINGGRDEITKEVMIEGLDDPGYEKIDYQAVVRNFVKIMGKVANNYVDALNIVHYMHDKYAYESGAMAFLDTVAPRHMLFGVTGISTVADSLAAISHGDMRVVRDEEGFITEYHFKNDFPRYGNNDMRADKVVTDILRIFYKELKKHHLYRNAEAKMSLQSVSDNIYYGSVTGATPDGRELGSSFAPGANPSPGYDLSGAVAALNSMAKIPYAEMCGGGFTNTLYVEPEALGEKDEQYENFINLIDFYFKRGGQQININVLSKNTLFEAQRNPEMNLIVGVSGCVVKFNSLTKAGQDELISRTFHANL